MKRRVTATTDLATCVAGAKWIVHCIPVQASRPFFASAGDVIPAGVPIISTSKGLCTTTLQMMTESKATVPPAN